MSRMSSLALLMAALSVLVSPALRADGGGRYCHFNSAPSVTFIEFPSAEIDIANPQQVTPITVKGKLNVPRRCYRYHRWHKRQRGLAAVLILHGSAGVDSRGEFYARALNQAGIATLEIDYWEARGVTGVANRPPLPILTYPDAFAGLAYLAADDRFDADRIGVLGFSWGGVMSLGSAEQAYASQFGQGLKFAAHAAHYPVCYGANNDSIFAGIPGVTSANAGTQFLTLTGAPVLIQIGSEDDYDNGAEPCLSIADGLLDPADKDLVDVIVYDGASHAWDRLQVPVTVQDPFADEGSFLLAPRGTVPVPEVRVIPDVRQAYRSRRAVTRFFKRNL